MIQDFCDKIFCINLDSRSDRWIRVQKEFHYVHIDPERFSAIVHPKRHVGCRMSHQAIVGMARDSGWDKVLIFEDDTVFHPDTITIFDDAVKQLPAQWDLLYFCCVPGTLEEHTNSLTRIVSCKMGNAVVFNRTIYDIVLASKEQSMDRTNLLVHPRGKSFCIKPMIAEQTHYRLWKT